VAASPSVVTSREFPALFHEIFNEPEQGQVFEVLGQWLAGRVPGQAVAGNGAAAGAPA